MASSSLLVVLMLIVCVAFVRGTSIATIKQYHICQECKTVKRMGAFGGTVYSPDPKTNCTLDDAFYIRKGYANVTTIDLLFNVIGRIYNETAPNCRTEFCQCARSYEYHDYDDHRTMFINSSVLNQVKQMVVPFLEKYKPYLRPLAEIKASNDRYHFIFPMTLIKIYAEFDFTIARLFTYNDQLPEDEFYYPWGMNKKHENHTVHLSCMMATYFNNRNLVITPTNAQLEARLGCDMINLLGKHATVQRFYFVNQWATAYPRLNLAGQTLAALFDKVNKSAANFKLTTHYSDINFYTDKMGMGIRGYNARNIVHQIRNTTNFTMCLFNSPTLRIDAERMVSNFTESTLRWVNFTFILDSGSAKPTTLTFNIAHNTVLTAAQNGTTVKSSTGANVYGLIGLEKSIEIYHLNSSSQIIYWLGQDLKISSPTRFFESATGGVMINGFTANGSGPKSG